MTESPSVIKSKGKLNKWEIVLLVLGSPIWFSLGIAAVVVILSIYVLLWSVIISLWAVFCSFMGCAVGYIIVGIIFMCSGNTLKGIAMIGLSAVFAGLSIFMFYGCLAATKGIVCLTKKIALLIKNCFIKKEEAK